MDSGERVALPIACTLGPADGGDRIKQWQTLLSSHGSGSERGSGYIEVRFRHDDAAACELERLVAAERECCSFVNWSLERQTGQLVLRISGEDEALATFSF